MADEKPTIVFPCCFCGQSELGGLPWEAEKGLALVNRETGAFEQQWWCHVRCLLDQMVPLAAGAYTET